MSNVHPLNKPGPVNMGGPIFDTLVNLLSNLGTAKDKTTHTRFIMQIMDREQLMSAYRGDWIARKIIDSPAQDSTREWRAWQAEKKDISAIEESEKEFKVQGKVKQAMIRARLWGGAALILGVDQGAPNTELVVDRVRKGNLKYVHVVDRNDLNAGELERDVTSKFYGQPKDYTINSSQSGIVAVHPSRVIRFLGNEIPDMGVASDGWGDSVLQNIYDAVIQAGQTAANVASLVNEARLNVVQVPDMMNQMGTAEYRGRLTERFMLANSMKSLTNTLILDKEEEWKQLNASFAGLPDIIRMYLLMASGAADIPATRLLGQSASGFNATGQEDTRNYYDRLSSDQRNDLGPSLDSLDEVLIRHTFDDKPEEVTYEWNSLWQLSDQEQAEVSAKKAQVYTADVNANLIPPEVLREGRENQLIEDGVYPGLEVAIDEYGEQNLDEYNQAVVAQMGARAALAAPDDPNDPKGGSKKAAAAKAEFARRKALPPPRPPAARSQDRRVEDETKPRTLYVRRDVVNGEEILAHFAEQGVDVSGVSSEDLHVTVLYSRQPVDWIKMGEANSFYAPGHDEEYEGADMCVAPGGPRVMEAYGTPPDTLVMCFASSALCWRHEDMIQRGASSDYPDYTPHVSICEWDGRDVLEVEPWQGEIYLGPEVFEPTKVGGAGGVAVDYDPDQDRDERGRWTVAGVSTVVKSRSGAEISTGIPILSERGQKKLREALRDLDSEFKFYDQYPVEEVSIRDMVSMQKETMAAGVMEYRAAYKRGDDDQPGFVYRVADDVYLIEDGNHRVVAAKKDGRSTVPMHVQDLRGKVVLDYDPEQLRNKSGEWTREGATAARNARIASAETERRTRAEGDLGARLRRTREAAVEKSKRLSAAAAQKAILFLKNNEKRSKSMGALAASLSGILVGADHVTESMVHQAVANFASTLGVTVTVARAKMREALSKAIELRRGLTGDADEPEEEDEILQTLLALLAMLGEDGDEEDVTDWRADVADYSPDQKRDKSGRWTSSGGGGSAGKGKSARGRGKKAGVQRLSSKSTQRKEPDKSRASEKRRRQFEQNASFIRRLNDAGNNRKKFDEVMADLESAKLDKGQLVTILKDYRLTSSMLYSARMSRTELLGRFRTDFTQMRRFLNKVGLDGDLTMDEVLADYSPDQPREPAGSGRGGQFTTIVGSGLQSHVGAAGMRVKLFKSKRIESGVSYDAKFSRGMNAPPSQVEVAQEFRVLGKWRKNPDQGGDYAAGVGWLLAKEFPGLAKFADQFWYDAAANMTPKEYDYAKSYFATRDGAFAEGYRAAFSPNGKAFGLNRQRTEEVFGRSTGQLRVGVESAISGPKQSSSVFSRMGNRLARLVGAS